MLKGKIMQRCNFFISHEVFKKFFLHILIQSFTPAGTQKLKFQFDLICFKGTAQGFSSGVVQSQCITNSRRWSAHCCCGEQGQEKNIF